MPIALRLFLASSTTQPVDSGQRIVVVLSFCTTSHVPTYYAWLSCDADDHPEWPEFAPASHLSPTHIWLPLHAWTALPHPDLDYSPLFQQAIRMENGKESHKSRELEERCKQIVSDGTNNDYTETLDYYTTLRVKCAFQRLNLDGINTRLNEVMTCMQSLWCVLRQVPESWKGAYQIPHNDEVLTVHDDDSIHDPNVLCAPRHHDFLIPEDEDGGLIGAVFGDGTR